MGALVEKEEDVVFMEALLGPHIGLGKLLPYQLPNPTQAHSITKKKHSFFLSWRIRIRDSPLLLWSPRILFRDLFSDQFREKHKLFAC